MSEHALHFVSRHGVWGGRGAISPSPYDFCFFGLSAQSRTVMMIIPLPNGGATGGGGGGPPPL